MLSAAAAALDPHTEVPLSELPVAKIAETVIGFLGEGADKLLNLVYGYDPALEAERDWIEENAYDTEVCAALVALLKVVYGPFLTVLLPGMKGATGTAAE